MRLEVLLRKLEYEIIQGNIDIEVSDVAQDSRLVKSGGMFICVSGFASDGHGYIASAYEKGAKVIVVQKGIDECNEAMKLYAQSIDSEDVLTSVPDDLVVVKVLDVRKALAVISAIWFGNPADKLVLIGLTGTKGKTTVAHMIKSIFDCAGIKAGMIGTIGALICDQRYETKNTTPDAYELNKLFAGMVDAGCTHCVLEVSSQALMLYRTYGLVFTYGAFMNISLDHIGPGEHKSFEEYFNYKKRIFDQTSIALINVDDEHLKALEPCEGMVSKSYSVSTISDASIGISNIEDLWEPDIIGSKITVNVTDDTLMELEGDYVIPLPGIYNVSNALFAIAICGMCGVDKEKIEAGLRTTAVKGRTQVVREASHIATFIIDYAHNALSMESLLSMLKGYNPKRLICIFGGGGNKPKQRRYDMGEAASKYADLVILTEDNPRFEEIENINNDIIAGLNVHQVEYKIILDRKEAIEYMLDNATEGDIVALIGKGHETYQDVKGVKTYFCEEEIIKEYVD